MLENSDYDGIDYDGFEGTITADGDDTIMADSLETPENPASVLDRFRSVLETMYLPIVML